MTDVSKIAPRIVYHGTSAKAAKQIMRGGFKEGVESHMNLGVGVHATPDRKIAGGFARYPNADARLERQEGVARKLLRGMRGAPRKEQVKTYNHAAFAPSKKRGRVLEMRAVGPMKKDGAWESLYHPDQLTVTGVKKGPKKFDWDKTGKRMKKISRRNMETDIRRRQDQITADLNFRMGIAKSKIPGGPWKPATELSNAERILVRRGKPHTPVPAEAEAAPKNNMPRYALHNGQRKRVLGYHSKDRFVLLNRDDSRQIAHRNSVTIVKNAMGVHDARYQK